MPTNLRAPVWSTRLERITTSGARLPTVIRNSLDRSELSGLRGNNEGLLRGGAGTAGGRRSQPSDGHAALPGARHNMPRRKALVSFVCEVLTCYPLADAFGFTKGSTSATYLRKLPQYNIVVAYRVRNKEIMGYPCVETVPPNLGGCSRRRRVLLLRRAMQVLYGEIVFASARTYALPATRQSQRHAGRLSLVV